MNDVAGASSAHTQSLIEQFQDEFEIDAEQARLLAGDPMLGPMTLGLITASSSSALSRIETAEAVRELKYRLGR